jgi:hypothetical protein
MAGLGVAYQNRALDAILGSGGVTLGSGFTLPANLWVALYTVAPTSAGGGTEVSGGGYARVEVANDATTFPNAGTPTPGQKANGIAVAFATSTGSWGTVTSFGIHDDPTADSLVGFGAVTTPLSIVAGMAPEFAPGDLIAAAA